jgi:hypothetical protein
VSARIDWRDAVRFWELGRLGYNGLLAALLIAIAMATDGWMGIGRRTAEIVALGAVANLLYCGVYPVELAAQALGVAGWKHWGRYALWIGGVAVSLLIAAAFGVGFATPF